jgi:hypothetical protein
MHQNPNIILIMPSNAVQVAVRVRPFNKREENMGAALCIRMEGSTCYIKHPETGAERDYGFDFCYWSHDGFTARDPNDGNSYSMPNPGSNYAD